MEKRSKKIIIWMSLFVLFFVMTGIIGISFAWFTDQEEITYQGEMGFVEADIDVYFDDGFGGRIEAEEVEISPVISKTGVYRVNITSDSADFFVEDLRIDIIVKSNIDTYLRIKIYEQLTFIYDNDGEINELAVYYEEGVDINYNLSSWYDNRIFDNYLYYQNTVKRIDETTPQVIPLVDSYYVGQSFDTRSPGYSLQMAFAIEAVQAEGGPENVWDQSTPPWGGSW
jgi:hypothetical protein